MEMSIKTAEKRKNFVRLAEKRTEEALNAIRKLGNLSNRRSYDWTPEDVKKITRAIQAATSDMEKRFDTDPSEKHSAFKL